MLPRLKLDYVDHREDKEAWALALGVSREAIEVYLASDVIDLHIDSFIWTRIVNYNLLARHGRGPLGGWFFGQVDLPRIREAQIGGGIWSITTNPLRSARSRADVFLGNLASLRALLERVPDDVHDKTQPLLVTHTGVNGVHPHWRNIDDEQLRAIARTGGTVGVMYNASFLGYPHFGGSAARIVDHLEHIVDVVGDDHASLGSDWDGMVVPPSDMRTCLELPRLAQHMLDRRWTPERIGKVLGGNFLRALGALRGQ